MLPFIVPLLFGRSSRDILACFLLSTCRWPVPPSGSTGSLFGRALQSKQKPLPGGLPGERSRRGICRCIGTTNTARSDDLRTHFADWSAAAHIAIKAQTCGPGPVSIFRRASFFCGFFGERVARAVAGRVRSAQGPNPQRFQSSRLPASARWRVKMWSRRGRARPRRATIGDKRRHTSSFSLKNPSH